MPIRNDHVESCGLIERIFAGTESECVDTDEGFVYVVVDNAMVLNLNKILAQMQPTECLIK